MKKTIFTTLAFGAALGLASQFVFALDQTPAKRDGSVADKTPAEVTTAQSAVAAKSVTEAPPEEPATMRTSKEAMLATRSMQEARLALFDGNPAKCAEILKRATTALDEIDTGTLTAPESDMIPIHGSLTLKKTFMPTKEQEACLETASRCFMQGQSAEGLKQLADAKIDIQFARVLLPLSATKETLANAVNLVKDKKYYEANLRLKAIEESIEQDTISVFELAGAETAATTQS